MTSIAEKYGAFNISLVSDLPLFIPSKRGMEMWKTLRVSHIPTPSAATTDKLQTRRYTNNLLGTKSRSAQYRLPIFLVARLTRYPDWGENQWDSTALPIPVGNRANSLGGFGHA